MSAINVVSDQPSGEGSEDRLNKKIAPRPPHELVIDSESDDSTVPDHHQIYQRKPEYDYLMDKYWRQKEKERIRNKDLEKQSDKGHGLHWQHKHFKPRDIFGYNEKEIKEVKKPELKIKQNSSYHLKEGDNYVMSDYNQRVARKNMVKLRDQNKLKQLIGDDIAEREAMHKIMELKTRDKDWDRNYHAERGDFYLQRKHGDFDKHWKHHDDNWNDSFRDVTDWSSKKKSHHHKNGAMINRYNFGRDPTFVPPQQAYPHHDKYWSRQWFDHYHSFERSKKMTLAVHHRFHDERITLEDYYHPEIRNMGPHWWLKHLKRQLETEPRPINAIGNVAQLIINNFPITIFTARYEKDHKKVLEAVEKYRKKADVQPGAVISIELDNSRAGLKIFSDLRYYSPMTILPQVWFNGELLGTLETLKKLKRQNRIIPLLREAEFEGKMPCELCQDVVKDWYSKWHRQHYPYFDRNIPYEGWG